MYNDRAMTRQNCTFYRVLINKENVTYGASIVGYLALKLVIRASLHDHQNLFITQHEKNPVIN